jgi:hypothetical protein
MNRSLSLGAIAIATVLGACQSQQQLVDQMEPEAQLTAQRRGAFEMNCPSATATVLSKEMMQTGAAMGPLGGGWQPPQRAQYTVGVSGCGKDATYMIVCAVGGTGCVPIGGRSEIRQQ